MKKTPSLFQRDYSGDRLIKDVIVSGSEWVVAGEGKATRKYDGTCCMIQNGELYARYDAKSGKTPPVGFIPAQDPDPITGHWTGWIKCDRNNPQWKWHFEAFDKVQLSDGTYELCGPRIQNNPEGFDIHCLIPHGQDECQPPRTFEELREWFIGRDIEGIVWHHQDGRMVKVKKKDFGLNRKD